MPVLRRNVTVRLVRDIRAYLNFEGGVTRGMPPDLGQENAQRLKTATRRVKKQREKLAKRNQKIARLKERLSQANVRKDAAGKQSEGRLPDFVIIGAQKCGTTFLYHLLIRHPQIEAAIRKQVNYFTFHFEKGTDYYRSCFRPLARTGKAAITGEASPYYLYHPHTARRLAEIAPRARLIVLLRNPIDRAYSNYHHMLREGYETLSFEEAIEAEPSRLRGEVDKMLADEKYASFDYAYHSYLSRGKYVDQLIEWSKFFSREQMLVIKSEDLFENVPASLKPILDFLELTDWEPKEAKHQLNEGSYTPMAPATRQNLRDYFEPYNERLYEYLGRDFGW